MSAGAVRKKVREYVVENLLIGEDEAGFSDEQSFLETGLIDSTGILEVIFFLENEFDLEIDDEEMVPENLDSVANIGRFVLSKNK